MRKSFTRLFGIFILAMMMTVQSWAATGFTLTLSKTANLKTTDKLVLLSDEPVTEGTGVVRLLDASDVTLKTYQASNSYVTISSEKNGDNKYEISVDFSAFFAEETEFKVEVDANFVKGATSEQNAPVSVTSIYVGDWTAPKLSSRTPSTGTTSVSLTDDLKLDFDEDIKLAAGAEVYIYTDNSTDNGNLFEVVSSGLSTAGKVLTIPHTAFKESTTYYVLVPEGAVVDDQSAEGAPFNTVDYDNKNAYKGWTNSPKTWVFSTLDNTAPVFSGVNADNIDATTFDVFFKLNKKGKAYVMAVPDGATAPAVADFTAVAGSVSVDVTAAATAFSVSLAKYNNGGTATSLVESTAYDVYAYAENADGAKSAVSKILDAKTADKTAPTVLLPATTGYFPQNTATDVDRDAIAYLKVKLSENVEIGTGNIYVYKWDNITNHTLEATVPATDCKVSLLAGTTKNDSLYIPVAKAIWESAQAYFVKYDAGIVEDVAGNDLAALTSTSIWKFTIEDFEAPVISWKSSRSASTLRVTATFDEKIYSNASATLMDATTFAAAVTVEDEDGLAVTPAPSVTKNSDLEYFIDFTVVPSTSYTVSIGSNKVYDASGNVMAAASETIAVKDFMPPVAIFKPTTHFLGKADDITISFDEPVFQPGGSAVTDAYVASVVVFRKGINATGAYVNATYSVSDDAKTFTIHPVNEFTTPTDQYYVALAGASVEDAEGNKIVSGVLSEIFTVDDFIAPTATYTYNSTALTTGAIVTAAATTLHIAFSEEIRDLAGNPFTAGNDASSYIHMMEDGENIVFPSTDVVWTNSGSVVDGIDITYTFKADADYTLSIGKSVVDTKDNSFEGSSIAFSTYATTAPAISSTDPADGATAIATNKTIKVTFDQPLSASVTAANISFSGTVTAAITVSSATIENDSILVITHSGFATDESVTVSIGASTVQNTGGVPNASDSFTFDTKDTKAPEATLSPLDGSTTFAVDGSLTLTFNEKVVLKTGTIYIRNSSNVAVQTLSQANCSLNTAGTVLTITPVADLSYSTAYHIEMTSGLVEDEEGNVFAGYGFTSGYSWDFTTAANVSSFIVESSNPDDNEDKVAAGITTMTFTFNRAIDAGSLSSTAYITLDDVTGGTTNNVFSDIASGGRCAVSGSTLTITFLSTEILAGKEYKLTLDAGVVTDDSSIANTSKAITFYTFDNNGPKVVSHTPATDAKKVAVGSTVVITWDEVPYSDASKTAITAAGIKTSSLVTIGGGTNYTAVISADNLTWTLTPDANFSENADYPVVVSSSIYDVTGKQSAGASWTFTTEDKTIAAPQNFTVTPTGNTTGTQVDFTVEFNEEGSVYYVAQPKTETAPTAAEVVAGGTEISYSSSVTSFTASVTKSAENLTSSVEYTFYFVAKDKAGNVSTIYSEDVTTYDNIAPVATITTPANEATGVAISTNLVLSFNEGVAKGTSGSVIIRDLATDIVTETIDITSASVTVGTDSTVTINPTDANFKSLTSYYVEVTGGAIVDGNGNAMAKITGTDKWAFTIADTKAPSIVSTTPDLTGTPDIAAGSTFTVEYDESVQPGTGSLIVHYNSNDEVFEVVPVASMDFSVDKKVSFSLVNVPVEQTTFYVTAPAGLIKDLAGNTTGAVVKASGWDFTILDRTAPVLSSAQIQKDVSGTTWSDADGATGVDVATNIVLTYNENILQYPDATAFTDATIDKVISLTDADGNAVAFDATITTATTVITINPDSNMDSEATYTVTISPVVDAKTNLTAEKSFSFTTKDMTAPVATILPANKTSVNPKTGVVTITFSEPVYDEVSTTTGEGNIIKYDILDENIPDFFIYATGTINADTTDIPSPTTYIGFTGTINAGKTVITLTPDADELPFASEAWYGVGLKDGVVVDEAGNKNVETYSIFQIEDTAGPVAVSYLPASGAADVDADLTVKFDEAVEIGSGNIYVRNYVTGDVLQTIEVSASTVTISGETATITHDDFAANTTFYITADAGTFVDASSNNNEWVGIKTEEINKWKFGTSDSVNPIVDSVSPANESENVMVGANLEITFDKPVAANSGNIVIYNEDWTVFDVVDVTGANVSFKGVTEPVYESNRVMVVNLNSDFASKSKYYVRMEKGVVASSGNEYDGLLDLSWSFTTEDNTAPSVVANGLSPEVDAENVDVATKLSITFDRVVEANAAGNVYLYKDEPGSLGTLVEKFVSTDTDHVAVSGETVVITPTASLEYNTDYYVIVEEGAFTNTSSSKLPFAGITTSLGWRFTTVGDTEAPYVLSATPDATTEGAAVTELQLQAIFNESVVAGTGNLKIYNGSDELVETVAIDAATISEDTVTVTLTETLAENEAYYVLVDEGIVKDLAGNTFAGVTDKTTWTFTTGDFTAPTVVSISPDNETIEANHPVLVLTLDEAVKLSTAGGSVTITKAGETTASVTIPLTASMISGEVVTITYPTDGSMGGLDKNTDYFVTVPEGALEDNSGNAFAGVTVNTEWVFKTGADFATGTDPVVDAPELKVYPNPFADELKVDNATELSRIIITSMTGQKVKEIVHPQSSTIQTNDLRSGVYFISLYVDDVVAKTERIVKR